MSRESRPHDPCADDATAQPGCSTAPLERLRFWNGRFLVARDLRHQQDDLIRRLEYHQRFAHGEGILCGYRLRRHPRDECERDWLVVEAGMAYDCCGHTLWMPDAAAVRIPRRDGGDGGPGEGPVPTAEPAAPYPEAPAPDDGPGQPPGGYDPEPDDRPGKPGHGGPGAPGPNEPERMPDPQWFVVARRVERPTDPQPALYADDLCEPVRHEHGRVREEVELCVLPADRVSHACWPRWNPVSPEDCSASWEDDCQDPRGDTLPCGQPCACGEHVVLAAVWRDAQGRLRWDTTHRRVLTPPTALTRITGVNWPHGGELPLRRLVDELRGRLVVRFSRRLRPAEGVRRGINPMTFTVSYLGQSGAWEEVLAPEEGDDGEPTPALSQNGRCAVFTIPRDLLTGRRSIAGAWVRVRLLGDFILDCHGRPVSAAHTGGDVNGRGSGNGVPGGTFESWFYVRNTWKEDNR